jgi:hypothetical protein
MDDIGKLRAALSHLEDLEAIRTVKARYCHLVDARRWDELQDLWTDDAVCDYGFFGCYRGREEIMTKFFKELVESTSSFMAHMVHNPVVEVNGDEASGSWYLTAQTTIEPLRQAVWVMGIYQDRFRRVGDAWKFSALTFTFKYYTPFEDGWAKTPMWEIPRA